MAFPQGIDFRRTAGYVTDPANCDAELKTDGGSADYPWTTAQGNNVGWETTSSSYLGRDRNSGIDARLAGVNANADVVADFRIDLPSSGNYNIGLGAGDANYANNVAWDLYDTTSSLGSLSTGTTSAANKFKDATNTEYSAAAWPGSQTLVTKTFATTICRLKAGGANQVVAHFYVEAAAATGGGPLVFGGELVKGALIRGGRLAS